MRRLIALAAALSLLLTAGCGLVCAGNLAMLLLG